MNLNNRVYLLSTWLVLLATPLIFFQILFFNHSWLGSQHVKLLVSGGMLISLMLAMLYNKKTSLSSALYMGFFVVFIVYNLFSIYYHTPSDNNALGAFTYNYSLFLFIFPFFLFCGFVNQTSYIKQTAVWFAVFIGITDLYAVAQFITNSYLIPSRVVDILLLNDYIKFDHISGHIRAMSFLKSPLELGIVNTFSALYFLNLFLNKRSGRKVHFLLFGLSALTVVMTISRTAILMLGVGMMVYLVLYVYTRISKSMYRSRKLVQVFTVLSGLAILSVFILAYVVLVDIVSVLWPSLSDSLFLNPTNLLIRLNNWTDLLKGLHGTEEWLFGLGIVQNGSYGDYHSVIIDNIYVGAILTGGLVGLVLFLLLCLFSLSKTYALAKADGRLSTLHFWNVCLAFFLAFMAGGLTENLMHLMYYPFFVFILHRFLSDPETREENHNLLLEKGGTT
ncbi:hypothetical protein B9G55_10425 [Saccharibacillus sp. O16]|nr:hypothetical protein B9G55_10425 [Saccharibacillus sp. O16]